jgi:hypothetical protein
VQNGDSRIWKINVRFAVALPRPPYWRTSTVGITLGEIRPVVLHGVGELDIFFAEMQPLPGTVIECLKHVWKFDAMEGTQFGFPFARYRAIKAIYKDSIDANALPASNIDLFKAFSSDPSRARNPWAAFLSSAQIKRRYDFFKLAFPPDHGRRPRASSTPCQKSLSNQLYRSI